MKTLIKESTLPNGLIVSLHNENGSFILDGTLFRQPKVYKMENVALKNFDSKVNEWLIISIV
ncbi:hypothetical protein [Psychrobacillus phage Perkons]|nr:hypothetical protein [Psychrobacillus phage Perkons]